MVAENFRGFRKLDFSLGDVTFVIGDNSSGKTSIIYLVDRLLSYEFTNSFSLLSNKTRLSTARDVLSPYVNSPTVTVGFFCKTLNRRHDAEINVRIATYRANNRSEFVLERLAAATKERVRYVVGGELSVRRKDKSISKNRNFKSVRNDIWKEYKHPTKGYTTFNNPGRPRFLFDRLMTAALVDIDEGAKNISLRFFSPPVLAKTSYGPTRLNPAYAYSLRQTQFDERGLHTPEKLRTIYADLVTKSHSQAINEIDEFGKQSGLFDKLRVGLYQKSDPKAPIKIEILKAGKKFSLDEVGYGVSQILPILVDSITSKKSDDALISIQQPELHLHPRAQAAFGELLFKLAKRGIRFLVETHSDYILDRFRYSMFKDKAQVTSKILFAENTTTGNRLHSIDIQLDGRLGSAPPGYRRFFMREQDKLFEMI